MEKFHLLVAVQMFLLGIGGPFIVKVPLPRDVARSRILFGLLIQPGVYIFAILVNPKTSQGYHVWERSCFQLKVVWARVSLSGMVRMA